MAAVEHPRLALGMMAIRGLTIVMRRRGPTMRHPWVLLVAPAWCLIAWAAVRNSNQAMRKSRTTPVSGRPMSEAAIERVTRWQRWQRWILAIACIVGIALAVFIAAQ